MKSFLETMLCVFCLLFHILIFDIISNQEDDGIDTKIYLAKHFQVQWSLLGRES